MSEPNPPTDPPDSTDFADEIDEEFDDGRERPNVSDESWPSEADIGDVLEQRRQVRGIDDEFRHTNR